MDLLGQEINNKNKKSSGKKMIGALLIICILLLLISIALLMILKSNPEIKEAFMVDDVEKTKTEGMFLETTEGKTYISLKEVAELIGYKYFNGEYGKNEEDKSKCYLENKYEIIGFEENSLDIYKISIEKNKEYQYYKLKNTVINNNEELYVELNDFSEACNIILKTSNDNKSIQIYTMTNVAEKQKKQLEAKGKYKFDIENYDNLKTLFYDMLIVNDGENYGVIYSNEETVIGAKYSKINFEPYTKNFIAKYNGKYGVLTKDGKVIIQFTYDELEIIKYSPVLYKVKQDNKYGIIDEKGKIIVNTEYTNIGYDTGEGITLLTIENVYNNQDGIIVYNGKYGILNLENGRVILDCVLDKIYARKIDSGIEYCVKQGNDLITLEQFIKNSNETTVNLDN